MLRFLGAAVFTASLIVPSMAQAPPALPVTAKKLTGAEITALYDGSTMKWRNYVIHGAGTSVYDLKRGRQNATLSISGQVSSFVGKIRVKGNKFCFTHESKETCSFVYTNGTDIYEVNAQGIVEGKLRKQ